MFKLLPVKEAIRILEEKEGYRFLSSKVERCSYDWTTTHKQGDYGVTSERVYFFETPKGNLRRFRTATLRSFAGAIS